MSTGAGDRTQDIYRHLEDLRSRAYEGTRDWPARVGVFRRAVELLDPVVRALLSQASRDYLAGTGTIHFHSGQDRDGGHYAHWEMSWPRQRQSPAHDGGRVEPVQVMVTFNRGSVHPHLRGAVAGMWPCQVTSDADATRQQGVLGAIIDAELHERINQGGWQVIPGFAAATAGRS